jgi:hypothetical protein
MKRRFPLPLSGRFSLRHPNGCRVNHDHYCATITKFLGPRGGVSDDGIKDDRLKVGAEITLVIAGNNKTVREVRLPMRDREEKKK